MNYFILDWSTEDKKYSYIEKMQTSSALVGTFDNGLPSEQEEIIITIGNLKGKFPDILVGGSLSPIVSQSFKDLLLKQTDINKNNLQFIEVKTTNKTKVPPYFFLNILCNLDAIDEEKSEITRLPKEIFPDQQHIIQSIEKLVLDEDCLEQRQIFRLEKKKEKVYVSGELKNNIEKMNLKGIRFIELT